MHDTKVRKCPCYDKQVSFTTWSNTTSKYIFSVLSSLTVSSSRAFIVEDYSIVNTLFHYAMNIIVRGKFQVCYKNPVFLTEICNLFPSDRTDTILVAVVAFTLYHTEIPPFLFCPSSNPWSRLFWDCVAQCHLTRFMGNGGFKLGYFCPQFSIHNIYCSF